MDWSEIDDEMFGAIFDRQGEPIGLKKWAELRTDLNYLIVRQDFVGEHPDDVMVSTVWLGMDHGLGRYWDSGFEPIIFETMAFGGNFDSVLLGRYSTEEEAEEGHRQAVAIVEADLQLEGANGQGSET